MLAVRQITMESTVYVAVSLIILELVHFIHSLDNSIDNRSSGLLFQSIQTEFTAHEIVIPEIYKDEKQQPSTFYKGGHSDGIRIKFTAFGQNFSLDLKINRYLFAKSYVEKSLTREGQKLHRPPKYKENHCHYTGRVQGQVHSMVAVSTCDGIHGYIGMGDEAYHIEPAFDPELPEFAHRLYRDSDMIHSQLRCEYGRPFVTASIFHRRKTWETQGRTTYMGKLLANFLTYRGWQKCTHQHGHSININETRQILHTREVLHRMKRSLYEPYNSNPQTRYVELFLVNDFRTFDKLGRDDRRLIQQSQIIANIVSMLYQPLNIFIVLVGIENWTSGDKIIISNDADETLKNFLHYRKERINPYHANDNAQLVSGTTFTNGVVGKAIKGTICTFQYSGGVNINLGTPMQTAATVAHEMGHNFGMDHDNYTYCKCPQEKCIMAATSGGQSDNGHTSPTNWSSCSHVALSEAFDMGMDYCLQNRPDKVFEGPICGNSFIETGEECDCGLPQSCDNKCCNATTCKLTPGSVCATGQCCDFNTCKYKAAATLCRPSKGECDLSEFCWGDKEFCPDDVFVQDSVPCLGGQSYCYNGECKTHTSQCKLLWGSTGRVSDPVCFKHLNGNGSKHGNCGYNWTTNSYKPCDKDDVDCGLLHCVHQNEKLMFWKDNFAHATPATFLTIGSTTYICRGAMLDVGVDMPDPGMVPDGAKCGDRKICKDKKCVYLSHLNLPGCPNGCNEGVCNSKGNCHCHEGYAPPNCDVPGTGGSIDSGPISMHSSNSLLVGLLVFFLVVIPLLGISIFLVYYFRRKLRSWCNVHIMTFKSSRPSRPQRPNRPPPRPTRTPERSPSDVSTTSQGRRAKVPVKNGNVYIEISGPVLTGSTNKDSHKDIQPSPKPRPSVPLRPNPPVPRPASPMKCAIEMTPQFNPVLLATTDESLQPAQKRELKREISSPVLISTTDRRSKHLIKVDSTVAHDIIPPPLPPHVKTVERSESDRSMAKRPLPPRPTSLPPQDNVSLHDVEEDSLQARKSMINASRMPLRPPPPPMKTDATNESNPMEEISEPKMKTSQPKSNMMKLNTQSKKGLPKTSVFRTNSDSSATKSGESKVANTSPAVKIKSDPKSNAGQWTIANKPIFKPKQRQASPKMGQSSLVSCDSTENPPNNRKESTESIEDDPNAGAASVAGLRKMFEDQKKALISGSAGEKELSRSNSKGKDGNPPPKLAPKPGKNIHTIDV